MSRSCRGAQSRAPNACSHGQDAKHTAERPDHLCSTRPHHTVRRADATGPTEAESMDRKLSIPGDYAGT
jgi:hypothetical protein